MNKHNYVTFFGFTVIIALMTSANCCPSKKHEPGKMGFALAIGLNKVNPNDYSGWSGVLSGCENDAKDMAAIASSQGFIVDTLITKKATRENLRKKLECLSEKLKSGDLLVVSYSGHGGNIEDANGDEENDGLDETWCLYDGEFIDDELFELWRKFQPGVRILVFSDSCHSGTVIRMLNRDLNKRDQQSMDDLDKKWQEKTKLSIEKSSLSNAVNSSKMSSPRSMSPRILAKVYHDHKDFYEKIGKAAPKEDPSMVKASIILISGCKDVQTSLDGKKNGLFTEKIKEVWQNGSFQGDHEKFHKDIKTLVESASEGNQSPNLYMLGIIDEFLKQRPYKIE